MPRNSPPDWHSDETTRVDAATLTRWKHDKFRYPPTYYLASQCLSRGTERRILNAEEREGLMDLGYRHTITCLRTRSRKTEPRKLEDTRCRLLGRGLQALLVAVVVQTWLLNKRFISSIDSVARLRARGSMGSRSALETTGASICSTNLHTTAAQGHPSVRLVKSFLRRAEQKGTDVRLDTGEAMSPDVWPRRPIHPSRWKWKNACVMKWKHSETITVLETRAVLTTLRWRLRRGHMIRNRFLHLIDNQAAIGVLTKGRSSSHQLLAVLKKINCLLLCSGSRMFLCYVETDTNPSDAGSRGRVYDG